MSADMQDLMAKLQMQMAQSGQPSFAGIQAPVDPSVQQNMLSQLQNQASVDNTGNAGGEYGFLLNAGKKDFQRAANAFGNAAQQGANDINGGPPTSPMSQLAAQQKAAVFQARAQQNQDLTSGVDPITAQANGLKILANAGIDVSDALAKNQEAAQKQKTSASDEFKNTQQGNSAADEIKNRALQRDLDQQKFDQATAKDTWTVDQTTPTRQIIKNALGDKKSVELNSTTNATPTDAQQSGEETLAQLIANGKAPLLTGKQALTPAGLRVNARAQEINPAISTADNKALMESAKQYTPGGSEGKNLTAFGTALNHGQDLLDIAKGLNSTDSQTANMAKNAFSKQFGGTGPVAMKLAAQMYSGEVMKTILASGGGIDERDKIEDAFKDVSTPDQLQIAVNTANKLLVGKVQVSRQNFERTGLPGNFEDKFLTPRAKALVATDPDYQAQFNPSASLQGDQQTQGPVKVSSEQQYNAVPKGTQYVAPDGSIRTKQ